MTRDLTDPTAQALREAFDRAFREPRDTEVALTEPVLIVRAGAYRFALPLADLAAVARRPSVTRVPSPDDSLVGIGVYDGVLVAIHDIGRALGLQSAPAAAEPDVGRAVGCALLVEVEGTLVGLACDAIEGQARPPRSAFTQSGNDALGEPDRSVASSALASRLVRLEGHLRLPVLDARRVVRDIFDRHRGSSA